ncbi:MAG: hypothetical protein ACFFB5_24100 [Promethearchaeota archaeon]
MVRKQLQMKKPMIFVMLLIPTLLSSHLTISISDNSWTLPENTIFSVALLFSGDKSENITACPWIFETNTSEKIIGSNKEFREYFSQDLSKELAAYPQITGIHMIEYTSTFNYFTNLAQKDPDHRWYPEDGKNVSKFDPYYCHLRFRFDSNQTWDDQLAMGIETMFLNQWYVERVMIIPDARVTTPSFGSAQFYLAILLILTMISLSRRKRQ